MSSSIDLAARLSSIVSLQQDILDTLDDVEKAMKLVVDRIPEVTSGNGAVIELVEGEEMVYRAASGSAAPHVGRRLKREGSLSGQAVRESAVLTCEDTDLDPRVDGPACRAIGIRSMIIAPLIHHDKTIGALKTFAAYPKAFGDLDSYAVQLLAGMTSAALMQARVNEDRKASERRYRLLFEKNVAGVFRSTLDGEILDCNDALVECLGYASREDLISHKTWDLYQERSEREQLLVTLQRDRALTNVRIHLKRKDGTPLTGVVNISLIPADNGESHVLGTLVAE
ncbi:MAG TPA: GAF domain-containing protein [Thermoanaerobaculia bacterium]|nr:GAF domain-containing protein [Thermoanaerobaculia bacterium]